MPYQPTRPFLTAEVSNTWRFKDFPPETKVDDLLRPDTWAHCAGRFFQPLDEIIVVPQGAPFRAHLIVMDKGPNWAKLRLIDVTLLNAASEDKAETIALPAAAPVKVEWKGPALKYCVIRTKDSERLRTGYAIKAEAEAWAAEHVTAMAA